MEIRIRGIDTSTINFLDNIAKENGISRNELLKRYINKVKTDNVFKSERDEIDYMLSNLTNAFEFTQKRLSSLESNIENILLLISISAGIDIKDIPFIINQYKTDEMEVNFNE